MSVAVNFLLRQVKEIVKHSGEKAYECLTKTVVAFLVNQIPDITDKIHERMVCLAAARGCLLTAMNNPAMHQHRAKLADSYRDLEGLKNELYIIAEFLREVESCEKTKNQKSNGL